MYKNPCIQSALLFLLSMFAGFARADIAPDPITGGKMITDRQGEVTDVRMVEEDVAVRIFEDEIRTVAQFTMHNEGETVEMEVGFPCGYPGEFIEFRAFVNGREVEAWDEKQEKVGRKESTVYWKLWKMNFEKGERCDIRVEYKTKTYESAHILLKPADSPGLPRHEFEAIRELTKRGYVTYWLQTGKDWKGKLDRCRIAIILEGKSGDHIDRFGPQDGTVSGGEIVWEYTDYEPERFVHLTYYPNMAVKDIPRYLLGIIERYPDDAQIVSVLGREIAGFGDIELKWKIHHSFIARWDHPIPQLMEYASGGRCRFNYKAGHQFYTTWMMALNLFHEYQGRGILDRAADIAPLVSRMSGAIVDSLDTCGGLPSTNEYLYKNAKEMLELSNSLLNGD